MQKPLKKDSEPVDLLLSFLIEKDFNSKVKKLN